MVVTLENPKITEVPRIDLTKNGELVAGKNLGGIMDAQMMNNQNIKQSTLSSVVAEDGLSVVDTISVTIPLNELMIQLSRLQGNRANVEGQYRIQSAGLDKQIADLQAKIDLIQAAQVKA